VPLSRGDRVSDFVLPTAEGVSTRFYGVAGGRAALLLEDAAAARGLAEALPDLPVYVVSSRAEAAGRSLLFVDAEGAVRSKLGLGPEPALYLLDANLRVIDRLPADAATVRGRLGEAPVISPREVATQAPVLLVPDALEREACRFLIEALERKGGVESGVEELYGGSREDVIRPDSKRRKDLVVEEPELMRLLTSTLGRRLFPEVQRAFAYKPTRFEGFKVARYEEGGFFRPHRDNLSPSTLHRRFSVTLNLDSGYEGGHLRFPEYGPHLYRPSEGGAVVFSAALLHEVLPVTRGVRHVLITFLFGEDGVRARG